MTPSLLALDTATEQSSVALYHRNQWFSQAALTPREHSQQILTMIDQVLAQAGIGLADLHGLVASIGPGSFTGVRIGVAIAQGLAFSAQLPVYPISTLQALAQQAMEFTGATQVVSAIDARMEEVYVATYRNQDGFAVALSGPHMAPLSAVSQQPCWQHLQTDRPIYGAGTGWQHYAAQLDPQGQVQVVDQAALPHATAMLRLALAHIAQGQDGISAAELEPLYVRNEVAWKKLPGRD